MIFSFSNNSLLVSLFYFVIVPGNVLSFASTLSYLLSQLGEWCADKAFPKINYPIRLEKPKPFRAKACNKGYLFIGMG